MAAPNIISSNIIVGVTTVVSIGNSNTTNVLLSNASSSGKAYKVNTIIAANDDGANNASITVKYFNQATGAGTSFSIANSITVPASSSIVIIGKDSPFYLEENRSIGVLASSANRIDVLCSYEEIS